MFGPGVEKDGVTVNKPTHFTVDATAAGTAPLDVTVSRPHTGAGLDLSFAGSQGEYHCMWRCPRPGLNPSGLVNNSSLAAGPQFTEMKILQVNC